MIVAVRISNTAPSEISTQPNEFKQQDNEETLNNWRGRTMLYVRQIEDKDKSNIWKWLRKSNLKESTKAVICSAHKLSPRTNYVKFHIDKTGESLLWRMCKVESKPISHIMGECKMRYDNVFIGNYAKNRTSKECDSGVSMNQMGLLRRKGTRFCEVLQSSVIPRLKFDDQILYLLIKPRRKLRS